MRVLPYGDRAVLIEPADPAGALPLRDWLVRQRFPGITAVVPAARTVLVEVEPGSIPELRALLSGVETGPVTDTGEPEVLELPVRYDGADLAAVAGELDLDTDELVALHSRAQYTVQFCGFSPGFGYLSGLDARLRVPRLTSPRPAVPAGSVAIADEYAGVYPRSSPGGWRLLGSTDVALFDLDRDPPAVLIPGLRVRFVPR